MNETTNTETKSTATLTRAQIRRCEELQEHLAAVCGAAALPMEMRDNLVDLMPSRNLSTQLAQANEMLTLMENAGFVRYDQETYLLTIPMG